MASKTIEEAAARLAERLRASPSDDIQKRLEARTSRVKELREQLDVEWTLGRSVLEQLIRAVAAQRTRILDAGSAFVDGLTAHLPALESLAGEAVGASEAAAESLTTSVPLLELLRQRLDDEVVEWTSEGGGFIVGAVEDSAKRTTGALGVLRDALHNDLRGHLQKRLELLEKWQENASKIPGEAIGILNECYEEWAARLAQVGALAGSDGGERIAAHAAAAAEAALEAAPAALNDIVDGARQALEAARADLTGLEGAMQAVSGDVGANLAPAFSAIEEEAASATSAQLELAAWKTLLQLFAPGGGA